MAPQNRRLRSAPRLLAVAALFTGTVALAAASGGNAPLAGARGATSRPVAAILDSAADRSGRLADLAARHTPAASAPAPTPRPVVVAVSTQAAAAATTVRRALPAPAPPRPVSYRYRLVSADGSLNVAYGYYSDCSGQSALTRAEAAIDTCVGGRTYFVGHNPGVFTPLLHMGVGSIISWYDGAGNLHRLRIIGVRTWYRANGAPPLLGGAVAEFQTCLTADGSVDRILDAAPA